MDHTLIIEAFLIVTIGGLGNMGSPGRLLIRNNPVPGSPGISLPAIVFYAAVTFYC
jgi:hypothetical protein